MREFTFRDKNIVVNIAGKTYSFAVQPTLKDKMDEVQQSLAELAKREDDGEANLEVIKICADVLDFILGEGAFEEICKDRDLDLVDYTDLFLFLVNEIKANYSAAR